MTTVADIINQTREEVLDDTDPQKYLWSDTELIHLFNRCYNELIKQAMLITDQSTTSITQIKVLSNLGIYPIDSRIIQINTVRLEKNPNFSPLNKTTEQRLDNTVTNWRNETGTPREFAPGAASGYLSIYPKYDNVGEILGASDITFVSATKTISQATGDFTQFTVGDSVNISGTILNNGYVTVATVSTHSMTVVEALVDESNVSAIIRKVRDTLLMTVNRLPTVRWTTADITNATPITEIREDHCDGFMDGIAKRAFLKPDTYTYYPQKAEYHRGLWEEWKTLCKRDIILLHKPDKSRVPRSGSSIYY